QLKPQVTGAQDLQVARRLFDTEAQALYKLGSHPQIPRLLAHFEDNKEFYLAQELIEGHPLSDEFATSTPWEEAQVVALLEDILSTLAFVHEHRVIHRDLKPSNLIRRHSDSRIVLIDFGAVKQSNTQLSTADPSIPRTISIGTQGYVPNEQLEGRPHFNSDLYAVGIIGIQALTGQHPNRLTLTPQTGQIDWHAYAPHTSPDLMRVLDAMVRYDFRKRYATVQEVLSALRSLAQKATPFMPPQTSPAPAQSSAAYPQLSPPFMTEQTVTGQTVPVLGRHPHGVAKGMTKTSMPTERVPVQSSHRKSSIPTSIPTILASLAVLGMGLLTWRACAPVTPTTATPEASPSTAETPVSEPATAPIVPPLEEPPPPAPAAAAPLPETTTETTPETTTDPVSSSPVVTAPVSQPEEATLEESEAVGALTPESAQTIVAAFYNHVSNQSWDAARGLADGPLAQQFSPDFFQQFQQVTVENVRVTAQTAETIELLGQNTYVYDDGSTQQEERTYTVQLINGAPRMVASDFVRVIKSRS
ncbi:MAG: serine/threonine-protein kinase, partial [Cyanobacteria bacterium J06635_1]